MTPNPTRREIEAVLRHLEDNEPIDLEAEVHAWIDRAMDAEEKIAYAEAKAIGYGASAECEKQRADFFERMNGSLRRALIASSVLNAGLILWLVWR